MTSDAERDSTRSMLYNALRRYAGAVDGDAVSNPRAAGALGNGEGDRRVRYTTTHGLGANRPDPFGQVLNPPRHGAAGDRQTGCPFRLNAHPYAHPSLPRSAASDHQRTAPGACPDCPARTRDAHLRRCRDGRLRGDDGAISVTMLFIGMVVILFVAALTGGGALFAARSTGFDLAQSAARAGAQQIDTATYRATGQLRLDPAKAAQAAKTASGFGLLLCKVVRCTGVSDVEKYCPESLWRLAQPLLPDHPKRHQGGGRTRIDDRIALAAIAYVLQTGCAWEALPEVWRARLDDPRAD